MIFCIVTRLGLQMPILKMRIYDGWKVRIRINIRTFHVKTNNVNMVFAFGIH